MGCLQWSIIVIPPFMFTSLTYSKVILLTKNNQNFICCQHNYIDEVHRTSCKECDWEINFMGNYFSWCLLSLVPRLTHTHGSKSVWLRECYFLSFFNLNNATVLRIHLPCGVLVKNDGRTKEWSFFRHLVPGSEGECYSSGNRPLLDINPYNHVATFIMIVYMIMLYVVSHQYVCFSVVSTLTLLHHLWQCINS